MHLFGYYHIDIAFPDVRLAVECDGDYWHGTPEQRIKDSKKDAYLRRFGWQIIRLPEHKINSDLGSCVKSVLLSLKSLRAQ
ncbi:MAG: DUF559 domain-containing protein [Candidatus Competibacteraceae bacterium]|nr:DUF559 domain-containing protein [Candidatus Competibacteraceae bacterium]